MKFSILRSCDPKQLLLALSCVCLSVLLAYHTFSPVEAVTYVRYGGYWYMGSTFVLFCWVSYQAALPAITRLVGQKKRLLNKNTYLSALVVVGCFAFTRLTDKTGFKVIMDEPVLAATALAMHKTREVCTPIRAHSIAGEYVFLQSFVDKRPYLFSFLTSLLHDLTGYRIANSFILNGLLSLVCLLLLFTVGYQMDGHRGGRLAVAAFASIPIYIQSTHSGGLETLNLSLILATWVGIASWLKSPTPERGNFLCMVGVLLSQARYESVLYLAPIGLAIVTGWWRTKKIFFTPLMQLTPLLLVPCVWHKHLFSIRPEFWEMASRPEYQSPFSLAFMQGNLPHAIRFFFSLDPTLPNAPFLAAAGGLGALAFFLWVLRQLRPGLTTSHRLVPFSFKFLPPIYHAFALLAMGIAVNGGLVLAYAFGQLDNPGLQRFSLPFYLPLLFGFLSGIRLLGYRPSHQKALIAGSLLAISAFNFPKLATNTHSCLAPFSKECEWILEKAQSFAQRGNRPLVISDMSCCWVLAGVDTMPHNTANIAKQRLLRYLNSALKPEIYVEHVCVYHPSTHTYQASQWRLPLNQDFQLELVERVSCHPWHAIELLRLVGIEGLEDIRLKAQNKQQYLEEWAYYLP